MAGSTFRRTLEASDETDVEFAATQLRAEAASAGIPEFSLDALELQVRESLEPLVHRGKELRALGSRLQVERNLEGPGYSIAIQFRVGKRPSLIKRIVRRLGMR